jgi:para-nitrobenzyl esterase
MYGTGMTVAATTAGQVRGTEIADGITGWRGIPYAAPPAGALRLRPPEPPVPWTGTRDATAYGNRAIQAPDPLDPPDAPPCDEDCLFVNVTAPAGAARAPVLVWVHGGGFESGSGTEMAGDGVAFARDAGLVVVTFNYRLGALGFLDLDGERPAGALGLHDQIAALRWVRQNIAAFGGDPDQITVYGLSAGGKSVTHLLASPLARGMIRRGAASSGGDHVMTPAQGAALAKLFFRELATTQDRIRDVPAAEILDAQCAIAPSPRTTWLWRPTIDGEALTGSPLDAIAAGSAAGVPLLLQTCALECALYQALAPDAAAQADRVLTEYFGTAVWDRIRHAYAANRPDLAGDPVALRVAVMTDERYVMPTTRLADAQSRYAPVWRSRYDGPYIGLPDPLPAEYVPFVPLIYAAHGADGTGIWQGGDGITAQQHGVWGAFAASGEPAASGLPRWPRYDAARRATMIFDPAGSYVADDPCQAERSAWDGLSWQPGAWWSFDGVS